MPYFIYALTEPNTGTVAYIGITNNTERRFRQHLQCDGTNVAKDTWVQELLKRGVKPFLNVLETVNTKAMAKKREKYWIRCYTERQVCLYNIRLTDNPHPGQGENTDLAALLLEEKFTRYFIYELVDPRTDVPGYVGLTSNPRKRYRDHINPKGEKGRKYEWIRHLQEEQIQPKMRILEVVSDLGHAKELEKHWIHYYISRGISLLNVQFNETATKVLINMRGQEVDGVLVAETGEIYYTASKVREILNVDYNMFSAFIRKRVIKRNRTGHYLKSDIDKFNMELKAFCEEHDMKTLIEFYA